MNPLHKREVVIKTIRDAQKIIDNVKKQMNKNLSENTSVYVLIPKKIYKALKAKKGKSCLTL